MGGDPPRDMHARSDQSAEVNALFGAPSICYLSHHVIRRRASAVAGPHCISEHDVKPTHIVGIGASAGGLEALEQLFRHLSASTGAAFVVVQHLSPNFESLMDELLQRHTQMPVRKVTDELEVEPNTVYLIPPRKEMIIASGKLLLSNKPEGAGLALPIDLFLRSLAEELGERAVGVVLSGTGSDGSRGVRAIHEAGGMVIVQSEASSKFDGMPRSAIATGISDAVLAPHEIAAFLSEHFQESLLIPRSQALVTSRDHFVEFNELLREHSGIDFEEYKPNTIARRVERRMRLAGLPSLEEYLELLRRDRLELEGLCTDLLIGVTSFFRDADAFDYLERVTIPELFEQTAGRPIRVWVAGCATGEEAYSIAILLHEEALRHGLSTDHIRIFATDAHANAIEHASAGVYELDALREVPERLRARYFKIDGPQAQVIDALRRMILFAHHNILNEPPFTKMDLVTCRNMLIYFKNPAQQRALALIHFNLNLGGMLFLGPSEALGPLGEEFDVVERRWKLFRKRRSARLPHTFSNFQSGLRLRGSEPTTSARDILLRRAYDALLEAHLPPGLLVDDAHQLLHTFGDAHRFMRPPHGRATQDVLELVDPQLRTTLSAALHRVDRLKETTGYQVRLQVADGSCELNVQVDPVEVGVEELCFLITFEEIVRSEQPTPRLLDHDTILEPHMFRHVEEMEDELRHTRERLQAVIEELETSNEELQAANEELLASNEELQSTNEELHSVNEELFTVNTEYQQKIEELTQANNDIDNLIRSTEINIIFLDRELRVRKFAQVASPAFNLLPQDMGRPIRHIQPNVNLPNLHAHLQQTLATQTLFEREVEHVDGTHLLMRVMPYRDEHGQSDGVVVMFVDLSSVYSMERQLRRTQERFELLASSVDDAFIIRRVDDEQGAIEYVSPAYERIWRRPAETLIADPTSWLADVHPDDRELVTSIRARIRRGPVDDTYRIFWPNGALRWIRARGYPAERDGGRFIVGVLSDVTERMEALHDSEALRERLAQADAMRSVALDHSDELVIFFDAAQRVTYVNEAVGRALRVPTSTLIGAALDGKRGILPPELVARFSRQLHEARASGGAVSGELVFPIANHPHHFSYTAYAVSKDQAHMGYVLCARERTLEEASAARLRAGELSVQDLFNTSPDAMFSFDDTGAVLAANAKLARLVDAEPEQLIGLPIERLLPLFVWQQHVQDVELHERVEPEYGLGRTVEQDVRRTDGTSFPAELHVNILTTARGRFGIVALRDLTQRRAAERERLEQEKDIREAQRLESLGMLAGGVAHDFNNLLVTIMSNAGSILDEAPTHEEMRARVEDIIQATESASELSRQMLAYSGRGHFTVEPLHLSLLILEMHRLLEVSISKGAQLTLDMPETLPMVRADAGQLRQVIMNLVINASESMEQGVGSIGVTVRHITDPAAIPVLIRHANLRLQYICMEVVDDGAGMSPEVLARIFDPFFSTKFTGRGLGLAVVQGIVRGHQGIIDVTSEPGQGTSFRVFLPTTSQIPNKPSLPVSTPNTFQGQGLVLVVDDEPSVQRSIQRMLKHRGFSVLLASDGIEGIDLFEQHAESVRLIVLDMTMPRLDGVETLRRLREIRPDARVLLTSGYGEQETLARLGELEPPDFIQKPWRLETFLSAVQRCLEG